MTSGVHRDALAIITTMIPTFTTESDTAAELEWSKAQSVLVQILKDYSTQELYQIVGYLSYFAAAFAVEIDREDPYAILQRIGKEIS